MKHISILGSTGSIGTQALNIIAQYRDRFHVTALSCNRSLDLLLQQVKTVAPEAVCLADAEGAKAFAKALEDTQKHIKKVDDDLEKLVGVRTRQINRKLSAVETLDDSIPLSSQETDHE